MITECPGALTATMMKPMKRKARIIQLVIRSYSINTTHHSAAAAAVS